MKAIPNVEPYNYSCFGSFVRDVKDHKRAACLLYVTIMAIFITVMSLPQVALGTRAIVGYSFLGAHVVLAIALCFVKMEIEQQAEYGQIKRVRDTTEGFNEQIVAALGGHKAIQNLPDFAADKGFENPSITKTKSESQSEQSIVLCFWAKREHKHKFMLTFSQMSFDRGVGSWSLKGNGVILGTDSYLNDDEIELSTDMLRLFMKYVNAIDKLLRGTHPDFELIPQARAHRV
jgi:hypothetical protein